MKQIMTNTTRTMALSALALALTACQSLTKVSDPVVNPNIANGYMLATGEKSIATYGYKTYFNNPDLIQVLDMALANNRDLRVAALNVEKMQAQYQIAENGQLPTVGATGGWTRAASASTNYKPVSVWSVGLGVTSYELDFWGRVKNLKDAALNSFFAQQSTRDATQVSLIAAVAEAWVAYGYAQENLILSQQTLDTQLKSYEINQKRFKVGVDSEVPLRQSQISVETARADAANYKTQVLQAKNALDLLVGQQVPANLLPKQRVKSITSQKVLSAGLPSDLLQNRPDLKAAAYSLQAAGANLGAAKARLYPTISLTGTAGLSSVELSDLFKSGSFVWSLAPTIDLPIFDWGTRKANIKVSKADQEIALANYEKAIQTAFKETNDVLATRAFIQDRIAAEKRLVEATNRNYQLSTLRFKAGLDNSLTVLDAQRTSYNAEQALLALQLAEINSQIELYKVLGGGVK